ncbi:Peroxisomal fatty acid beta-oxidation multifunctional protein [Arachis hypogaea]|nr:Peroxisomal fatty acid beta-oxidation multifunctional protein [Arachis hypogaea]
MKRGKFKSKPTGCHQFSTPEDLSVSIACSHSHFHSQCSESLNLALSPSHMPMALLHVELWIEGLLQSTYSRFLLKLHSVQTEINAHNSGTNDSKNNGKGYYIYEKGSKPKLDLSILPIVEELRRLANIMPGGKPISITDQEILEMILFPIVNEAGCVLDEGMVIRASDLDIACVLGMSFPSYSFLIGAKHVYNSLKKWSELYGNSCTPDSSKMSTIKFSISSSISGSFSRFEQPRRYSFLSHFSLKRLIGRDVRDSQ